MRNVLKVGLVLNIAIVIFFLVIILGGFFINNDSFDSFIFSSVVSNIRLLSSLIIFIFWIYLMVLWSRYDKSIGRFFALFFLMGSYSIYYAIRLLKSGKLN